MSSDKPQNRWLFVNNNALARLGSRLINGVQVEVMIPPTEVPHAVRGFRAPGSSLFVIEFGYIADEEEPKTRIDHSDSVAFVRGRNSSRLYRIELDVKKLNANAVGLKMQTVTAVENAIKNAEASHEVGGRFGSLLAARELLTQQGDALLGQAVAGSGELAIGK